jgi:hypothetical protein
LSAARARAQDGLRAACYAWAAGKAGWGARGVGRPGEKPSWAGEKKEGAQGTAGPREPSRRERGGAEGVFFLFISLHLSFFCSF